MPKIIYVENLFKGPFFALLNCVCTTGLLLQNKESSVEDQNFSLVMNRQMKKMNYSNTYLAALILVVLTKEFVCIIKCFLRKFKLSMDIEILKDILFYWQNQGLNLTNIYLAQKILKTFISLNWYSIRNAAFVVIRNWNLIDSDLSKPEDMEMGVDGFSSFVFLVSHC